MDTRRQGTEEDKTTGINYESGGGRAQWTSGMPRAIPTARALIQIGDGNGKKYKLKYRVLEGKTHNRSETGGNASGPRVRVPGLVILVSTPS